VVSDVPSNVAAASYHASLYIPLHCDALHAGTLLTKMCLMWLASAKHSVIDCHCSCHRIVAPAAVIYYMWLTHSASITQTLCLTSVA
jgi:hypothetical protein